MHASHLLVGAISALFVTVLLMRRSILTEKIATLLNAGSRDLVVTSPDELLSEAAAKMLSARIGRLPVVDPTDPTKLVGYLGRGEFILGYEKSHQEEHHRERSSLLQKAVKFALRRKVANKVGAEE
jgi:CBS-domain-containing membrane protein